MSATTTTVIDMSIWNKRDDVLQAIYDGGNDFQHFVDLRRAFPTWGTEDLQNTLRWLVRHELIEGSEDLDRVISSIRITPLGENFAETNTSVEKLSQQSAQGAIMNYQHNVNNGPALNAQGDNNVINQQNQMELADDFIATLRQHGESDRADELEQEKRQNGPRAAIAKGVGWVANKLFAAPVLAALAPYVAQQAAGMA